MMNTQLMVIAIGVHLSSDRKVEAIRFGKMTAVLCSM